MTDDERALRRMLEDVLDEYVLRLEDKLDEVLRELKGLQAPAVEFKDTTTTVRTGLVGEEV
jgi:hypothetical protein